MTVEVRPLGVADAGRVQPLAARAFDDLAVRQGRAPTAGAAENTAYYGRVHAHLLATGTGLGAFAGEELVGAALSYVRGSVWVLALLVVEPQRQSEGAGRALLQASLADAPPLRVLHSSGDARAMRLYAEAGFRLLPGLTASGQPDVVAPEHREADLASDAAPAGCEHLVVDLEQAVTAGGRVLALADGRPGLALAFGPDGRPHAEVVGAAHDDAARDLLRVALFAAAERGGEVEVGPFVAQQHWGVEVALEAGLELAARGPVAVAGCVDPLARPCPPSAVFI